MDIIKAPKSGFCFGVKKAIETAENAAKNGGEINSCKKVNNN